MPNTNKQAKASREVLLNLRTIHKGQDFKLPVMVQFDDSVALNAEEKVRLFFDALATLLVRKKPKTIVLTDWDLCPQSAMSASQLKWWFDFLKLVHVKNVRLDFSNLSEIDVASLHGKLSAIRNSIQFLHSLSCKTTVAKPTSNWNIRFSSLLPSALLLSVNQPRLSIWRDFSFEDKENKAPGLTVSGPKV